MNRPILGKPAVEALGIRLRDLRRDAGLSGRRLAGECGWAPSKISKIEYGRQMPSEVDVREWCIACGFPSEIAELVETVRSIDAQFVDWRRSLKGGTHRRQRANVDAYERTNLIRAWEPSVVPGLLQTPDYARAILDTVVDFHGIPDDVDAGVTARMDAQRVLHHGDRRFLFVLGEAALHTMVGGPDVMRDQLRRLVEAAGHPRISLGVLPLDAPYSVPRNNGFTVYDSRLVTVPTYSAELVLSQRHEIALYERAFDRLLNLAARGARARDVIERRRRNL